MSAATGAGRWRSGVLRRAAGAVLTRLSVLRARVERLAVRSGVLIRLLPIGRRRLAVVGLLPVARLLPVTGLLSVRRRLLATGRRPVRRRLLRTTLRRRVRRRLLRHVRLLRLSRGAVAAGPEDAVGRPAAAARMAAVGRSRAGRCRAVAARTRAPGPDSPDRSSDCPPDSRRDSSFGQQGAASSPADTRRRTNRTDRTAQLVRVSRAGCATTCRSRCGAGRRRARHRAAPCAGRGSPSRACGPLRQPASHPHG